MSASPINNRYATHVCDIQDLQQASLLCCSVAFSAPSVEPLLSMFLDCEQ